MKIKIISPTKAKVTFEDAQEKARAVKFLTYRNTSVQFQLKKHRANRWWKQRDPGGWGHRDKELLQDLHSCLLDANDFIRPGIIPHLKAVFSVNTMNSIDYPDFRPLPWKKKPEFDPYPYQAEAVKKLMNIKHGNISLPTGCGKSFILLNLAKSMGLKTVVVTPSKSIFNELLKEFQDKLGKNNVGGYGDGKKDYKKTVTVAIGRSMTMLKPDTEAYAALCKADALLVDESHTFAASELEKVCHGIFENVPYRMFVSATQTRGDGTEKMLYSIIGKNVLEMGLSEAISDGYLCPLKFTILNTFSPSTKNKKDPLECKREHFLYNGEIAKLAAKIANASAKVKDQSTLILVEELRQIQMLEQLLEVPYGYVHSASKKDAAVWNLDKVKLQDHVDAFNHGDIKVLIGTKAIATGTNMYPTHNVINWVGGSSEIVTKQGTMGRSTRKLEISKFVDKHPPKPLANIYDFRIQGEPLLEKQLQKRISFYQEAGGEIKEY